MARRTSPQSLADLSFERELGCDRIILAGMDEVGRGALAGPVCVGAVVVTDAARPVPAGLTDSKLLSPARRTAMVPLVEQWADAWAIGAASAAEIDAVGIIGALRLAGQRALAQLAAREVVAGLVLLDGSHDWLSEPDRANTLDLFSAPVGDSAPPVVTRVKADVTCASVAAASVLAKCHRDAIMVELDRVYPGFGWAGNKGYGSAAHREAIGRLGPVAEHRRSWRL